MRGKDELISGYYTDEQKFMRSNMLDGNIF